MRSATRTSSRPAASPSADERDARVLGGDSRGATRLMGLLVCSFGDLDTGLAGLAWDVGEPGGLLLCEQRVGAASFALEESGDAATVVLSADDASAEAIFAPRDAALPLAEPEGHGADVTVTTGTAEVRSSGKTTSRSPGLLARWDRDAPGGRGHLQVPGGRARRRGAAGRDRPWRARGRRSRRGAQPGLAAERRGGEPLRGDSDLHSVRRRGHPHAHRTRALARGRGPDEPSRRDESGRLGHRRLLLERDLGRALPLPHRRDRGPGQRTSSGAHERARPDHHGDLRLRRRAHHPARAVVRGRSGPNRHPDGGARQGDGADRAGGRSSSPVRA